MIEFWVPGDPATQGSKTPFRNQFTGKVNIVDSCKRNKAWRGVVAYFAHQAMIQTKANKIFGPVKLSLDFALLRPLSHLRGNKRDGIVKTTAPAFHIQKPDTVKLARAVEDALKDICWVDDSQIVVETITKRWHQHNPGVQVTIEEVKP